MGASVWPDEWRRGNKWDGGAGEGSRRGRAGRWAALSPDPLPTPPLSTVPSGGCSCPPPPGAAPVPREGSPQTHGSPGVAGRGERGQFWRGKAGWCWGCGLLEAGAVMGGCPQGASGSKARTGCGAWRATKSGRMGRGSLGARLAWLGAATGPSMGSKEGQAAPEEQAGMLQEKEDPIHPHRAAGGSLGTGWAACGGESCVPCLLGQATALLPLLLGRSSFLQWKLLLVLRPWDTVLTGSEEELASKPALVISRGSGTSQLRSKILGCPGDRGTHGAQQMLANLALWEPICAGEAQQLSCQWGWWRCGDRVAELTAGSLAFPIPAFPSPRARGSWCPAQPLPRECLRDTGATLVCRQSHYKITRLEAGTHQIQPWNRGYSLAAAKKRSKERRWLSMAQPQEALPQAHAVTQMLAEVAQSREVTRAARRPPPLRWQSPDGCSFPGTRHLRRVGRRRAGRAAGKSQPGQQRGEQMVQPAGERRHLPARAGSQGHGAAPCRHPRALPGRGGSGARGLHTPHLLPLPKTRMSSLLRGSKHRIGQRVRPKRSGRWEDVGAMPPPRSLAEAGSAVCLQALSRKVFLEEH